MKALIIDDERLARTELIRLLEPFKEIEIIGEAVNAEDAHNKISELNPDVIFLDIHIEPIDGFAMLKLIRQSATFQATKVIALTASVMN